MNGSALPIRTDLDSPQIGSRPPGQPNIRPWIAGGPLHDLPVRTATAASMLHFAKARFRRFWNAGQLSLDNIRPALGSARHVVVCVVRNEVHRLQYFLDYYRDLGFEHFVVIDNMSTDGTAELLAEIRDVSYVAAHGSYKNARFGNDWINQVINRFCREKWVLYVDADEFLVFPGCDARRIGDLTAHMEKKGDRALSTVMIDMYSCRPVSENICAPGQNPLDICALFDSSGYFYDFDPRESTTWIKGGVRARVFFKDNIWTGPALNKIPLVHVTGERLYLKSSHQIWPLNLNLRASRAEHTVSGALLHFKFLASFSERVSDAASLSQHTAEYAAYSAADVQEDSFIGAATAHYRDWRDLAAHGLLDGEHWTEAT